MENVLILGDARLLEVSEVIDIAELGGGTGPFRSVEETRQNISDDLGKWRWELAMQDCAAALSSFRAKHGYGRAISAVQGGHPLRLIFFDLGEEYGPMYGDQFAKPFAMINPELHNLSGESRSVNDEIDIDSADKTTVQSSFTMWDDCLSLPNMMVLVRRSTTCDVSFLDIHGIKHVWRKLALPLAELLQVCHSMPQSWSYSISIVHSVFSYVHGERNKM